MNRNRAASHRVQARRDRIYLDFCDGAEYETLQEMAAAYGVSAKTLRSDLDAMERTRQVRFELDSGGGLVADTIRVVEWTPESEGE